LRIQWEKSKQISDEVISKLKSFDWDFIINFALNHVSKIKGNQYNFLRGGLIEDVISEQDDQLIFGGVSPKILNGDVLVSQLKEITTQ
jgi:hypothetical protein